MSQKKAWQVLIISWKSCWLGQKLVNTKICKLCQQSVSKLVKSHIIPRAFYYQRDNGKIDHIFIGGGLYPKRSQDGVYSEIVCETCECMFAEWDDYAIKLLRDKKPDHIAMDLQSRHTLAFEYESINYEALKLFCLSLLWRVHASDTEFFSDFKLSNEEARDLTSVLLSKESPDAENWAVFIGKNNHFMSNVVRQPELVVCSNVRYAKIYFPQHVVIIQLQKATIPQCLLMYLLYPNTGLRAFYYDIEKVGHLEEALNVAKEYLQSRN